MEPNESISRQPIVRWEGGRLQHVTDEVVGEEPLEIRIRGRAVTVAMRTPGHDEELAAGFLLSEGIVRSRGDIVNIQSCERNEYGNVINVLLAPETPADLSRLSRNIVSASSCGICGKTSIDAIHGNFPAIQASDIPKMRATTVTELPDKMRQAQPMFERTGGVHAAALFNDSGELLVLREDVGRHNAVDKVLGHALLNSRIPLQQHILLVSGRVSFEIMQKALSAGIALIAAVSAPSSLAVEFAQQSNQTLIGLIRGQRMNVYAGVQRIIDK